jgi:F-type H+-transporting ATPase subunit gamma
MALKQVKNKIIATQKTGKVTKAMEAVSAVKMRKSQEKAFQGRPYVRSAMEILSKVAASGEVKKHPFSKQRETGKKLLVIVTSDKGLAGSVNSAVLKKAEEYLKNEDSLAVIAIGKKALEFGERNHLEILQSHLNMSDAVTLGDVESMTAAIFREFSSNAYQSVAVIYQNFLSTFEQEPTVRQILPLIPSEILDIMKGIKPKTGRYSDNDVSLNKSIDYTIEPSGEAVMETLIPTLIKIMLYHALLESKASEHSARMVAMKNATDKAKDVIKGLTIQYNKARQSAITAEVSEITAGVEAMRN